MHSIIILLDCRGNVGNLFLHDIHCVLTSARVLVSLAILLPISERYSRGFRQRSKRRNFDLQQHRRGYQRGVEGRMGASCCQHRFSRRQNRAILRTLFSGSGNDRLTRWEGRGVDGSAVASIREAIWSMQTLARGRRRRRDLRKIETSLGRNALDAISFSHSGGGELWQNEDALSRRREHTPKD